MKEKTQLNELKKLLAKHNAPYSINDLIELFNPYQLLLTEACAEADPLYSEWKILNTLYQQCLEWQIRQQQSEDIQHQKRPLKAVKKHVKQKTSPLLAQLQAEHEQLTRTIEPEFKMILKDYNALRQQKNPLSAVHVALDLENQRHILSDYCELLETAINDISFDLNRLALHTNQQQREVLVNQLKQDPIISPLSPDFQNLPLLKTQMNKQLNAGQEEARSLHRFHDHLATHLAQKKAIETLETLSNSQKKVNEDLQKITEQISTFKHQFESTIAPVTTKFDAALDKKAQLKQSQDALSQRTSYLNLFAWHEWITTPKEEFNKQIKSQTLEVQLMQLLATQDELNKQSDEINQKLTEQQANLDPINQSAHLEIPPAMVTLLALNPDEIKTINDIDLFDRVIAKIKSVNTQTTGHEQALTWLNQLIDLEKAALAIHQQAFSKLKVDCSTPLNDTEVLALKKSHDQQQLQRQLFTTRLQSCKDCETSLNTLKQLSEKINRTRTELNSSSGKDQKKRRDQQLTLAECLSQQAQLESTITQSLTAFNRIYVPEAEPKNETQVLHPKLWEQLNQWNLKINKFSRKMSGELNIWYDRLFQALTSNATDETSLLQSIQLLHDIHFELNCTNQGTASQTLEEYCVQYANPSECYRELLHVKPALALIENAAQLPSLIDKTMQKRIENLYEHQRHLAPRFPKEAALLQQAAVNLHQIALNYENKKESVSGVNLTFYADDSRYQCLEKHRGFKKVWEWLAQLCTNLINKINNTPNSNYRNRFFFTPTQSHRLLHDAATTLNSKVNHLSICS